MTNDQAPMTNCRFPRRRGFFSYSYQPALAGFSIFAFRHWHHRVGTMASHVYHEIYLHITWHTKDDSPLLLPNLEPLVHKTLTERCHQTKGVYFHGINGTPTHVHLA